MAKKKKKTAKKKKPVPEDEDRPEHVATIAVIENDPDKLYFRTMMASGTYGGETFEVASNINGDCVILTYAERQFVLTIQAMVRMAHGIVHPEDALTLCKQETPCPNSE